MLVVTRKRLERVVIRDKSGKKIGFVVFIDHKYQDARVNGVRLGFEFSRDWIVNREEVDQKSYPEDYPQLETT